MLELRPCCEICEKYLPPNSTEAMICTYECTFCKDCAENDLKNVCPNCGGGFEKRPVRPRVELENNPASKKKIVKPLNKQAHRDYLNSYLGVSPEDR